MGTHLPSPKGAQLPNFQPISVVAKWLHGSRCHFVWRSKAQATLCLMGTPLPLPKRGQSPQIFGPCLLWPNGWMDQDGTWHGGRPQPMRLCVRWVPSSPPQKGGRAPSPIFGPCLLWPNGWIKMALGMEVGLGTGDIVLGGDPAPLPKKGGRARPNFRPIFIVAKWVDESRCHLVWR